MTTTLVRQHHRRKPELNDMSELVEAVAEAIHDAMFEERYADMPIGTIERAMARTQAVAALNAVADFGDARFKETRK